MTSQQANECVWYCPDTDGDDFVVSRTSPEDSENQSQILTQDDRNSLSRFMSWALRHNPDDAGITLDQHGWTDAYELTMAAGEQYEWITPRHIAAVVSTDSKGRYEVSGDKIRAVYGHSDHLNVTIPDETSGPDTDLPIVLYHGTGTDNVSSIRETGLNPMSRQHVHLTDSVSTAIETGHRHSDSVTVLKVTVEDLLADGFSITKRGEDVYVTSSIPLEHLSIHCTVQYY